MNHRLRRVEKRKKGVRNLFSHRARARKILEKVTASGPAARQTQYEKCVRNLLGRGRRRLGGERIRGDAQPSDRGSGVLYLQRSICPFWCRRRGDGEGAGRETWTSQDQYFSNGGCAVRKRSGGGVQSACNARQTGGKARGMPAKGRPGAWNARETVGSAQEIPADSSAKGRKCLKNGPQTVRKGRRCGSNGPAHGQRGQETPVFAGFRAFFARPGRGFDAARGARFGNFRCAVRKPSARTAKLSGRTCRDRFYFADWVAGFDAGFFEPVDAACPESVEAALAASASAALVLYHLVTLMPGTVMSSSDQTIGNGPPVLRKLDAKIECSQVEPSTASEPSFLLNHARSSCLLPAAPR